MYLIYRSRQPDFTPGPASFVTYVAPGTFTFRDLADDFDAQPLSGTCYYRVTARSTLGFESKPTPPVQVTRASVSDVR